MKTKTISFRSQLKGSISDFLAKENMQCPHTENGLLELVVALSHYTEEGNFLFPEIILCDDLKTTLSLLQCSDPIQIGRGDRNNNTVLQAIKRCAPLTRETWKIYILRLQGHFEYGIFKAPYSPTALSIRDTILSLSEENQTFRLIYASQIAEKAVELIGTCSGSLNLYLSATPDDEPSPAKNLNLLIKILCSEIDIALKEQAESFIKTILINALRQTHGTIIGVIDSVDQISKISTDGIIVNLEFDLSKLVDDHEKKHTDQSLSDLICYGNLLSGMIASDGIVFLNTRGNILGYNFFVKDSETSEIPQSTLIGGARRRAFSILCKMVDNNLAKACFFQSNDGSTKFHYKGEL